MKYCIDGKSHYEVLSQEMSQVDVVCDDGTGPLEYWCDYALVLAVNKREARSLAIKDPGMKSWVEEARQSYINPFSGMKATLSRCEHGWCWACEPGGSEYECEICISANHPPTDPEGSRLDDTDKEA